MGFGKSTGRSHCLCLFHCYNTHRHRHRPRHWRSHSHSPPEEEAEVVTAAASNQPPTSATPKLPPKVVRCGLCKHASASGTVADTA